MWFIKVPGSERGGVGLPANLGEHVQFRRMTLPKLGVGISQFGDLCCVTACRAPKRRRNLEA
jgi:hypothetical protein